jgi:hypothetical protein
MKLWRKKGPLGKLHNVSVYITMSTQRLDAFRLISGNLRLPRDNSTRWNSWYRMLVRALLLREAINTYTLMNRVDLQDDVLSDEDWSQLESLIDIWKHTSMEHFLVKDDTLQLKQSCQLWNSCLRFSKMADISTLTILSLVLVVRQDGTSWRSITTRQENHVLMLQLFLHASGSSLRKVLFGEKNLRAARIVRRRLLRPDPLSSHLCV